MKKYALISLLYLAVGLYSCSVKKQSNLDFYMIDETNMVIPDSLFSFFPRIDENKEALYFISENAVDSKENTALWFFNTTHYIKVYKYDNIELVTNVINSYKPRSIACFQSQDSIYFTMSGEDELTKRYSAENLKEVLEKNKEKYVVASFHSFAEYLIKYGYSNDISTTCGLPNDYTILMITSGRKLVLPGKYTFDWDVLPKELKHGYASGIAYSEKDLYILYWVVAW